MRESASPLEVEEDDGETVSITSFSCFAVGNIRFSAALGYSVLLIFLHLQYRGSSQLSTCRDWTTEVGNSNACLAFFSKIVT